MPLTRRDFLRQGGIAGGAFTIMHHSGQRNNIVPALDEWNELTGLNFQSVEIGLESDIYVKAMNEAVVRTGDYDIFLTFCNWIRLRRSMTGPSQPSWPASWAALP
jgi:hypothetical protein